MGAANWMKAGNSNTLVASATDIVEDLLGSADGALATRNEIASNIQFPTNFINRSEVSISFFFKTTDSGVLLGIQDRADYQKCCACCSYSICRNRW